MRTSYYFSFDTLEILGGFKNTLHIYGTKYTIDETKIPEPESIDPDSLTEAEIETYNKLKIEWTIDGPLDEVRKTNLRVLKFNEINFNINYLANYCFNFIGNFYLLKYKIKLDY